MSGSSGLFKLRSREFMSIGKGLVIRYRNG